MRIPNAVRVPYAAKHLGYTIRNKRPPFGLIILIVLFVLFISGVANAGDFDFTLDDADRGDVEEGSEYYLHMWYGVMAVVYFAVLVVFVFSPKLRDNYWLSAVLTGLVLVLGPTAYFKMKESRDERFNVASSGFHEIHTPAPQLVVRDQYSIYLDHVA